jgi:hypothetical protein
MRINTPVKFSKVDTLGKSSRTYHQVLRAALQASIEFDIDPDDNPMASAVRTAMPQYM